MGGVIRLRRYVGRPADSPNLGVSRGAAAAPLAERRITPDGSRLGEAREARAGAY